LVSNDLMLVAKGGWGGGVKVKRAGKVRNLKGGAGGWLWQHGTRFNHSSPKFNLNGTFFENEIFSKDLIPSISPIIMKNY